MKKRLKKMVALLLVLTLSFSLSSSAFAADYTYREKPDVSQEEYVDIVDEQGNVISVLVEIDTYYPTNSISLFGSGSAVGTGNPVGTLKTIRMKISNAQLDGFADLTGYLSEGSKMVIASYISNAVVAQVGPVIAAGLSTAYVISSFVSSLNVMMGNSGFSVTVVLKVEHFEHKLQGIDLNDWNLDDLKIVPY